MSRDSFIGQMEVAGRIMHENRGLLKALADGEELEWKHQKKKGKKKPYVIESRYIGPDKTFMTEFFENLREWHVWKRYSTEASRDQALEVVNSKRIRTHKVYSWYEYRAGEDR